VLGIHSQSIINENPYFQRATTRKMGCQIDYLIQMRLNTFYICEIKFHHKPITKTIIPEIQQKIEKLKMPKNTRIRQSIFQLYKFIQRHTIRR